MLNMNKSMIHCSSLFQRNSRSYSRLSSKQNEYSVFLIQILEHPSLTHRALPQFKKRLSSSPMPARHHIVEHPVLGRIPLHRIPPPFPWENNFEGHVHSEKYRHCCLRLGPPGRGSRRKIYT